MDFLIKFLGYDDYFYVLDKNSMYNSSNCLELHSINSDEPLEKGMMNIIKYLLKYRFNT